MKTIRTLLFEFLHEQISAISDIASPLFGWEITPTDRENPTSSKAGLVQIVPSTSNFVPCRGAMAEFDFSTAILCKSPVNTAPNATTDRWTEAADKATLAAAEVILLLDKAFHDQITTAAAIALVNAMCDYKAGFIVTHFDDPHAKQVGRADFELEAPGTRGTL